MRVVVARIGIEVAHQNRVLAVRNVIDSHSRAVVGLKKQISANVEIVVDVGRSLIEGLDKDGVVQIRHVPDHGLRIRAGTELV